MGKPHSRVDELSRSLSAQFAGSSPASFSSPADGGSSATEPGAHGGAAASQPGAGVGATAAQHGAGGAAAATLPSAGWGTVDTLPGAGGGAAASQPGAGGGGEATLTSALGGAAAAPFFGVSTCNETQQNQESVPVPASHSRRRAPATKKKEKEDEAMVLPEAVKTKREAIMLPLTMVAVQVIVVGMLLLSKISLSDGMSPFVIIVYRNMIAAATVAPFAVYFEREMWKEINWSVCCWIFANAAFGDVLAMGLYFYGLRTTSAAYSSIFLNLIPIATFAIAVVLRAENLALGQWMGKMKLLGTLLCVGGTMMVSLLKGPLLHLWPTNVLGYSSQASAANATGAHHNMVVGTLWLCGSCISYALYFIVQERLVKLFPSTYWMTSLTSLVGSIQALVVGVFLVRDRAEWTLHWNMELLTVVYSGVLNTGLAFLLLSWVISRSGPIYPTMFNSVCLVLTTVLDSVLLGTDVYLGSVIGTVTIVVGMYAFLWGKDTELKRAAMELASPVQEA